MKTNYNKTLQACFVGYVVQAIVNNFVLLPEIMPNTFTGDAQVIEIGAYGFHWMTFPVTEIVTTLVGVVFYML